MGPPFQSYEFRQFMEYCGIRHRRITPLWPRANAQAENFMKPLNKAIKAATIQGKSWRREMFKFLHNYRATPHLTTGKPPAELLFGINIRILLPEVQILHEQTVDKEVRLRDSALKTKQKHYADLRNCSRPPDQLQVGDTVLIRQDKHNKLTPPYNPEPMTHLQAQNAAQKMTIQTQQKTLAEKNVRIEALDAVNESPVDFRNIPDFSFMPREKQNLWKSLWFPRMSNSQHKIRKLLTSTLKTTLPPQRTKTPPEHHK